MGRKNLVLQNILEDKKYFEEIKNDFDIAGIGEKSLIALLDWYNNKENLSFVNELKKIIYF